MTDTASRTKSLLAFFYRYYIIHAITFVYVVILAWKFTPPMRQYGKKIQTSHIAHDLKPLDPSFQPSRCSQFTKGKSDFGGQLSSDWHSSVAQLREGEKASFPYNLPAACVLGAGRERADIAVGIPTIKRPANVSYLHATLTSLFTRLLPRNEDRVAVVVMVTGFGDTAFVARALANVYANFARQVHNGMLQVVVAPSQLQATRHLFGKVRIAPEAYRGLMWDTNVNLAIGFLMNYCKDRGEFYLTLEDDVAVAGGYVEAMLTFVRGRKRKFAMAAAARDESAPGKFDFALGRLIPRPELPALLEEIRVYYKRRTIGEIFRQHLLKHSKRCKAKTCVEDWILPDIKSAEIVQHIGKVSSQPDRVPSRVDIEAINKKLSRATTGENPQTNRAVMSYESDNAFFAVDPNLSENPVVVRSPDANARVSVVFGQPQRVTKLLVKSGNPLDSAGRLDDGCGVLNYCRTSASCKPCARFYRNGEAECRLNNVDMSGFALEFICDVNHDVTLTSVYVESLPVV